MDELVQSKNYDYNTRCTPSKFFDFINQINLKDEHKKAISTTPFKEFLRFPRSTVQRTFLNTIIRRWDNKTKSFIIGGNRLFIKPQDIALILGLSMNGESLDMKKKLDVCDENFKNKYFPNALILRNLIEENIKRRMEETLDECLADFTKLFILYIFNTILFPTSNHATPKFLLHYVNNLEKLNNYNWATAVYEFLVINISKCVEEKKSYVNGCVMILEPWLQEHIIHQPLLTTKMVYPRLLRWVEGGYQHADTHRKYIDNLIYTQVIEEIKPTYEERNLLLPPDTSNTTEEMCCHLEPKLVNMLEKIASNIAQETCSRLEPIFLQNKNKNEISSAVNEMCRQFEPKLVNIIENLMIQNKKNEDNSEYRELLMENKELRDKIVDKEIIIQRLSDEVKELKRNRVWEATSCEIIKDMQVNSDIRQGSTPFHANTKNKETFVTNQYSLVKRVKAQGRKRIPSKVLQSPYTKFSCKSKGKSICETPGIQSLMEKSDEYMLSQEEANAIMTLNAQNKIKDETFGPLHVERRSLESLLDPMKWVDDEVISKYTELMAIRENSGGHNLLKCHFFNAWFHKYVCTTRIIAKGEKKIEDIYYDGNDAKINCIIRKIPYELKSREKIMIPLNEMSHWYLLVMDLKRKVFSIYNSLKGHQTSTYINTMVSRLKIHLLKNCEIECDGFTVSVDQECPQQPNSVDCGVYLMKFMECLSRGDIFDFNPGPMNFERKKMVAQLILGKMITPQ